MMADDDSFDLHVNDTLNAGAGLCREDVVRTIVGEGPALVRELIELGVRFTAGETPDQQFDFGREGGHTKRRILHAGDITGREIERALPHAVASQPNITVFENVLAVDLITSRKLKLDGPNRCLGCYALNDQDEGSRSFCCHQYAVSQWWLRQGLSLHEQPRHRERRRRGDGVSRRSYHREHGVHSISSHLSLSSKGEVVPDQRSGPW